MVLGNTKCLIVNLFLCYVKIAQPARCRPAASACGLASLMVDLPAHLVREHYAVGR